MDNVEDGDGTNLWGGFWNSYAGAPNSVSAVNTGLAGAPASVHGAAGAAGVTGSNAAGAAGSGSLSTSLNSSGTGVDLSGTTRLRFWFRGSSPSNNFTVLIHRQATADWNDYALAFSAPANAWTFIDLDLDAFAQDPGWGAQVPRAWNDAVSVYWITPDDGAFDLRVDDVEFTSGPKDTPTPTSTSGPAGAVTPGGGPNEVVEALPDANPNPGFVHVKMAGPVDAVRAELWTKSMAKLGRGEGAGIPGPGWTRVDLREWTRGLPNGTYYVVVVGLRQGQPGPEPKIVKVVVLR